MLDTVQAVRFIKELTSGRNRPWLIEAERQSGEVIEVVLKLGSFECGSGGLIREAYSALFAADLGLPVSEPFVVELDESFIATLTSTLAVRCVDQKFGFGCMFVPNMLPLQQHLDMPQSLRQDAASALAFDAAIVNSDRLVTKPNCLTDGRSLLLIDHELSLNLHGRGFLVRDPWTTDALEGMRSGPSEHLFYAALQSAKLNSGKGMVDSVCERMNSIAPNRVSEYADAIPAEWDNDMISADIAVFMGDLLKNVTGLKVEVEALLS